MEEKSKIFIGNISFNTSMDEVLEMFSQFGEIKDSYRPKGKDGRGQGGFAFITFVTEEAANKAVEDMNGKEVDGRELVVNIARPREERPRNNFNRGGDRGGYGSRGGF